MTRAMTMNLAAKTAVTRNGDKSWWGWICVFQVFYWPSR
jgi:hypothetical protein